MKKIQGVELVKVSLNQGRATIVFKPGNSVRLEQIRKAVTEQGFTPKEARVKAVGDLTVASNGHLQLRVSGSNEVFLVMETPHTDWRKNAGNNVLVSGMISAPATDKSGMIQITEVSKRVSTVK